MTCEEYATKQGSSDLNISSGMNNQQLASSNKPTQTDAVAATCIVAHN